MEPPPRPDPTPSRAAPETPDVWSPPDAATSASDRGRSSPNVEFEEPDADGPPPPPYLRRRRRRIAVAIAAAILLIGLPLAAVFADLADLGGRPEAAPDGSADDAAGDDPSASEQPDDGSGPVPEAPDDGSGAVPERPDDDRAAPEQPDEGPDTAPPDPPTVEMPPAPDLGELEGLDAVYGQLLLRVDAAERVMIAFQDDLEDIFSAPGQPPDELFGDVAAAATAGRQALGELRVDLDDPIENPGADGVRTSYLRHLDAWERYMTAIAEDPLVLADESRGAPYNVEINASADAFARILSGRLPDTADRTVRDYAEAILDRGFRSVGRSEV